MCFVGIPSNSVTKVVHRVPVDMCSDIRFARIREFRFWITWHHAHSSLRVFRVHEFPTLAVGPGLGHLRPPVIRKIRLTALLSQKKCFMPVLVNYFYSFIKTRMFAAPPRLMRLGITTNLRRFMKSYGQKPLVGQTHGEKQHSREPGIQSSDGSLQSWLDGAL